MIHPAVRDLLQGLGRHPAFQELLKQVAAPGQVALSGLTTTSKALYSVLLWELTGRPLLLITDGNNQAETVYEAVETFFALLTTRRDRGGPLLLPALDVLPKQGMSPHAEICERRAVALWRLSTGHAPITVVPVSGALLRLEPGDFYRQLALRLRVGDEAPLDEIAAHLESIGYQRREPVEMVGEYSVRGGLLDVFSPESSKPVRIDLFGDQIESIRRFEVESQRSVLKTDDCTLLPLTEYQRSPELMRALGEHLGGGAEAFPGWELMIPLIRPRQHSIFSLLEKVIVLWDEPEQISGVAERLWRRLEQDAGAAPCPPDRIFFRREELEAAAQDTTQICLRELALEGTGVQIATHPSMSFHGNIPIAVAQARSMVESGTRVAFFAASTGELERMADILNEYGVAYQLGIDHSDATPAYLAERAYMAGSVANVYLIHGRIRKGAVFADSGLALFGSEDLFDASELIASPVPSRRGAFSADALDLKPGDLVVHTEHGIGRFLGLREIEQGEARGDYMLLEYAGEAKLYLPLARMDLVQRFRGAGEGAPPLDRLGGVTWSRTKSRVKAKLRDMADELLKLYAARRTAQGFRFSADSNWQREFEDAFEFAATRDQLTAVEEIKRDMEALQPMDRLLCGDVGFGKTEVVMRAAFKALGDGKQVSVLAPTTVLAFQHFETFKQRFQPFPVRVEMASRFRTPKEIRSVLADLAAGKVDILIGTHRLLSKDVEFRDLGLVIVDEEQRFGVRHKERLKQIKKSVDVISMSATPIPRTLHMSMLGLRDLSVIETPPKDRLAIQTVVTPYQMDLIRSAIETEIGRGGQVYFLHNRVDSIWARAAEIQQHVPQARIAVGHGQMSESELEKTMLRFMRHECDILVCTTIIENGLDIPLANTIIVENTERYGLSELYQLRGRVGRSNRRAYAYLLVSPNTELSETARKRLAALKEFSNLGGGFKIAALDLELRGAGNLLGSQQHGHINTVGFDMYVRLLEETVREMKGEEPPLEIHSRLNLGLDIRIPANYIQDESQRLRVYRGIASAANAEARQRIIEELEDRYGSAPEALKNLLEYSALKTLAEGLGVEAIDRRQNLVNIKFHKEARVSPDRLKQLVSRAKGAQFTPAGVLLMPLDGMTVPAQILGFIKNRLLELQP